MVVKRSRQGAGDPVDRSGGPFLSIVVPVYDEEENIGPLVDAVRAALAEHRSWELLLVDDGSRDATAALAAAAARADSRVRLLGLARNFGQTAALQAGFDHARGEVVVSMDGDLQNDPRDIPYLVEVLDRGYDLVAGYRARRQDELLRRRFPSWAANRVISWLTGVSVRDTGCTLRVYRRGLLDQLHLYADMHRFLPSLAVATTGARIMEVPVRHHPRVRGTSKYGLSRVVKLSADLLTLKMISTFRDRPLIMFGGAALFSAAFSLVCLVLAVLSLRSFHLALTDYYVVPAISLLWLMLAVFLLLLGLVSEVVLRASPYMRTAQWRIKRSSA
jgi:glycosyltransferase involved in cell wall biosynthesis